MSFLNLEEYLIDGGLDFVDWFTKPTYLPYTVMCAPYHVPDPVLGIHK